MMKTSTIESHIFVIFGGTGDLAQRKLMPALYHLLTERGLKNRCVILGVARSAREEEGYRELVRDSIARHVRNGGNLEAWCGTHVYFQSLGRETEADYVGLRDRIAEIESTHGLPGHRVFYLALPPEAMTRTMVNLGKVGLHEGTGWTRGVIEKPFGYDLESAAELNKLAHRYYDESQLYRIDHYLGKETVQNLLVFRFANSLFESVWNRDKIQRVDFLVSEELGVEDRARYYDQVGALRDMVQNHMMQLLTLIAMEVPVAYEADAIRNEKLKVLRSVQPLTPSDITLGQYAGGSLNGTTVPAYRDEDGVPNDSATETYVDVTIQLENWRWQGVPFRLVTGKRLPKRLSQIVITFRQPPVSLFQSFDACRFVPNVLTIRLQPDEGFSLSFEVKKPGEPMRLETKWFDFDYRNAFGPLSDAYETLLYDIMIGNHTLFVHADEVEEAWRVFSPILTKMPPLEPYRAGTWGPDGHRPAGIYHQSNP